MTPSATAIAPSAPSAPPRAPLLLRRAPAAPRPGIVGRDRLVRRLLATETVRVVLVRAPAGYGKTTLLDAWAKADPRPFERLPAARGALARSRWSAPCVLVADGWSWAHGDLSGLADEVPPGCLLVVVSRGAPDLRVGRLRVQGDVLELGPRDLAMTHGEALALLEASGVHGLGPGALDALMAVTEGWPAALSLAAQSLAGAEDPDRAAAAFGAADPDVADYLRDELLTALPPEQLAFLLRCSVLATLDADLCQVATGTPQAAALLEELERSELPITRVDRATQRLRCHPLLRELLAHELRRRDPGVGEAAHRRASAWFAAHDDIDGALRHAVVGGDLHRAGELLWRVASRYAWDGRRAALDRWLGALPRTQVERHAALGLSAATADLSRFALDEARHRLTFVDLDAASAPAALRRSLQAGRMALEAALAPGGPAQLREGAAAAAAVASDADPARALCCLLEGAGAALAGDSAAATEALEAGARRAVIAAPGLAALCLAELALAALCSEDWDDGARLAERARSRAEAVGVDAHPSLGLVLATTAFARAHRGRFAEAREDIARTRALLEGHDDVPAWYGAQVGLALARALLRLSDVAGARAQLAAARRAARRLPGADALSTWIDAASAAADDGALAALDVAEPLTTAELRVLRFLPSHRSFREIGGCLHVSPNTIKSQAHAIYRKLGASSRSVAVERARALGLLDDLD